MKNLQFGFALLLAFVASSFTLSTNILPAHVDYYLKIEGVDGESTAKGHKGWIELESVQLNTAGKTVTFTKKTTAKSSPALKRLFTQKTQIKKAVLHVRKVGGGEYMQYELENVLITNYQTSAGESLPLEEVSFSYGRL